MSLLKPQMRPELAVECFKFVDASLPRSSDDEVAKDLQQSSPVHFQGDASNASTELKEQIYALESSLSQAVDELERARSEAYDEGMQAGRKEAEKLATEGLSLLQQALMEGRERLQENLESNLDAGITIARAILRSVLGKSADLPGHIVETAKRWKEELEDTSIISLRVSPLDFPDSLQLGRLEKAIGGTKVQIDPALNRGACLFELTLGSLDASIPKQLENAEEFLDPFVCDGSHS